MDTKATIVVFVSKWFEKEMNTYEINQRILYLTRQLVLLIK